MDISANLLGWVSDLFVADVVIAFFATRRHCSVDLNAEGSSNVQNPYRVFDKTEERDDRGQRVGFGS